MADWKMKRNMLRAMSLLLIFCGILALHIVYISVFKAEETVENPLNQRTAALQREIARGRIMTSDGKVLAETRPDGGRTYPWGEAAAAVTGYNGENIGGAGLEAHRNMELMGMSRDFSSLGPVSQLLQADQGNDLETTIDSRAQETAYEALAGSRGAAVVLDAKTGAILAMVSTPAYDPNVVEAEWQSLKGAEESPLLNRVVQGLYPPGSTIKPLTAAAALGEGVTDEREVFACTGRLELDDGSFIGEYQGEVHGQVNLEEALAESCNVAFGTLGLRLGGRKLGKYFEDFGFPQEIGGEILMAGSHLPRFDTLGQGDLAQTAIGQASLLVTPMHMALMASVFANGGTAMKPYLVQKVISPKGIALENTRPEKWRICLDAALAAKIDSYMEQVVQHGTGTGAAVRGLRVTGKTGTAENASGADHAWFIGSAELPGRKIAFAIIVENGGSGGRAAAPIARRIIESMNR